MKKDYSLLQPKLMYVALHLLTLGVAIYHSLGFLPTIDSD